jgi:hypothetical protein
MGSDARCGKWSPTEMRKLLAPLGVIAGLAVSSPAVADGTIRSPGDHPDYHVDIEPHGILGSGFYGYGFVGFGGGIRFSIPLCKNCFIPKINNNVAISFGADAAFYPLRDFGPSPWFLFLPVALQWNFFVAKKWSIAAEPGFTPWVDVSGDTCGGTRNCWSLWPSLAFVGRYHFTERVALTMRVGFPEFFNVGVSFWL